MNEKLEIKKVPFMDTELLAARDSDGQIWAGVRWMCNGIGLSKGQMQRQLTNIGTDKVLSKGVANLQLPTSGGPQETLCLKLDYVPLWLAKISITPAMEAENPELANRLEQYQLKAKDALAAAFLPEACQAVKPPHNYPHKSSSVGEIQRFMHELRMIMKDNNQPPEKISEMAQTLCDQFEINLPVGFVKKNPFEQVTLFGGFWTVR